MTPTDPPDLTASTDQPHSQSSRRKRAWSDLDKIALRIGRDNPAATRRQLEKIKHVIGLLGDFPGLSRAGRVVGTRERVVPGSHYVIVFEVWEKPRALVVTGVVHGADLMITQHTWRIR